MAHHDTVLAVFIAVVALAFIAQAVVLFFIYQSMKHLYEEFHQARHEVRQSLEPMVHSLTSTIEGCGEPVRTVARNLAEISQVLRERTTQVDAVVAELADRSRAQIIRIDEMVTQLAGRVEHAAAVVQDKVLAPIQEASAVAKGVRAGIDFLFSRRQHSPTPSDPIEGEELFI